MNVRALYFFIPLAVLCGCETNSEKHLTNAAAAKLPANWVLAENKEEGVSMGVPPGWREGVGGTAGFASFMQEGLHANQTPSASTTSPSNEDQKFINDINNSAKEEQAEKKEHMKSAQGIVLQAIDTSMLALPGMQQTRYYVKKVSSMHNASLDEAVQAEGEEWQQKATATRVNTPLGEASRMEFTTQQRGQDIFRTVYAFVDGKNTYLLRFVGVKSNASIQQIEKDVVNTLRIKPGQ